MGVYLAPGFVVQLLLFQRLNLGLGKHDAIIGDLGLQGFQALFEVRQVVA